MSNTISLHSNDKDIDNWLSMSNGATSAFISIMVLSGSRIAKTIKEKDFIVWLAEHDQSCIGIGTVGFEISEMPWDIKNFEEQKEFLIKVINGVRGRLGWETLDYEPNQKFVNNWMDKFEKLISLFTKNYIDISSIIKWYECKDDAIYGIANAYPKCIKHEALLSWCGCVVCNDV